MDKLNNPNIDVPGEYIKLLKRRDKQWAKENKEPWDIALEREQEQARKREKKEEKERYRKWLKSYREEQRKQKILTKKALKERRLEQIKNEREERKKFAKTRAEIDKKLAKEKPVVPRKKNYKHSMPVYPTLNISIKNLGELMDELRQEISIEEPYNPY